jgi:hypothetical protein
MSCWLVVFLVNGNDRYLRIPLRLQTSGEEIDIDLVFEYAFDDENVVKRLRIIAALSNLGVMIAQRLAWRSAWILSGIS